MAVKPKAAAAAAAEVDDDEDETGEDGRETRTQPLEIKGLPAGVKAVLRLKPWRDVKEYSAYIYRKEPDKTRPGRWNKKFLDRVYNTEIEESYLQTRFPRGGKFSIMYQMPHPLKPGDIQIHSDDYDIDPSNEAGALVAPGAVPVTAGAQAPAGDLGSSLANLRAMAEIVAMLKGDQVQAPAAPAWMEKMYQDKLRRLDELEDKMQRKLGAPIVGTVQKPPEENAAWPEFLRPFAPQIKAYGIQTIQQLAGKLLGAGLESAGLRYLVLNNPAFKAMWQDEEKRNAAASTIIAALGEAGENLVQLFAKEMQKDGGQNGQ